MSRKGLHLSCLPTCLALHMMNYVSVIDWPSLHPCCRFFHDLMTAFKKQKVKNMFTIQNTFKISCITLSWSEFLAGTRVFSYLLQSTWFKFITGSRSNTRHLQKDSISSPSYRRTWIQNQFQPCIDFNLCCEVWYCKSSQQPLTCPLWMVCFLPGKRSIDDFLLNLWLCEIKRESKLRSNTYASFEKQNRDRTFLWSQMDVDLIDVRSWKRHFYDVDFI